MKKIITAIMLVACVLTSQRADAELVNTNLAGIDSCVKFTETLYMAKDTWLRTSAVYSNREDLKEQSEIATRQVKHLHVLLEKEGFVISKKEKSDVQFGRTTAIAVAGLQNKYKAELLTSQNLTYSYGVLDEKGVEFLNQKYGCVNKVSVKFQEAGKTLEVAAGSDQSIGYVVTGVPNKIKIDFSVVDSSNDETPISSVDMKNGKGILEWKAPANRGTYVIRAKIQGSLFSEVTYIVLGSAGISGVTTESTWTKSDGVAQKVNFTRTDLKGTVYACLVDSTTSANGVVVNGVLLGSTGKSEITVPDSKISGVVPGQYKVLVTNSPKKCETNISLTAVSNTITVVPKPNTTSSSESSNTSSTDDTSDTSELDTSTTGSVTNTRSFDVIRPNGDNSVKAGAANGLTIRVGNVKNVPNTARGTAFLVSPDGSTTELRQAYFYYCSSPTADCVGFRSAYGVKTTIPSGTPAGTGYKIRIDVSVSGLVVSDTGEAFTITN